VEFNMEPSLAAAHAYLDAVEPFEEIYAMLFNHGVEAVGLPTIDEWERLLARATRSGEWLGADTSEFPMDYAQFARYHTEVQRIAARHPLPPPLTLAQFGDFLEAQGNRYEVNFEEERPGSPLATSTPR
jgi:hypothetical protein